MKNFGGTIAPDAEQTRESSNTTNAEIEREAVPLAHEAIHETVARILAGDGQRERGLLLDVPAGEGALAARLLGAGFEVRCCDLYP